MKLCMTALAAMLAFLPAALAAPAEAAEPAVAVSPSLLCVTELSY